MKMLHMLQQPLQCVPVLASFSASDNLDSKSITWKQINQIGFNPKILIVSANILHLSKFKSNKRIFHIQMKMALHY